MMRKVALVLFLSLAVAGGAFAANPSLSAGGGGMNVLDSDRAIVWSELPNLDGLIASSEVIGDLGLETEIANDFMISQFNTGITVARWWGGYYNGSGCGEIGVATNWNLRLYEDAGCTPGNLFLEALGQYSNENAVYCQAGIYPIFQYEANVWFPIMTDTRYWFSAQASSHAYPPQVGRVASASTVGCTTVFRSAFFSFPDWTASTEVFGVEYDASQEFEDADIPPPDWGACCIGDQGECQTVGNEYACEEMGGEWQGYFVPCDPNPCEITPVERSSWGRIKAQYR
jgi:hypothetical protein